MSLFLSMTLFACRAERPTVADDFVIGHDPEYGTVEAVIPVDSEPDTGEVIEDTAVEETEQPCNYELYVVGLSEGAVAQGYEIGLNCFPTRPTLHLLDEEVTYSYPFVDAPGIGWTIAAAPEGDVAVESVYGSVDFYDDYGSWSENFDNIEELAARVFTYGYTTVRSDDTLQLGGNFQHYATPAEGFDVAIGSYGDFTPITVPKGDAGEIWLQLDLRGLSVTSGDKIVVEQFPVITWHAEGVPTVMTKENMDYQPDDNQYVITFE